MLFKSLTLEKYFLYLFLVGNDKMGVCVVKVNRKGTIKLKDCEKPSVCMLIMTKVVVWEIIVSYIMADDLCDQFIMMQQRLG